MRYIPFNLAGYQIVECESQVRSVTLGYYKSSSDFNKYGKFVEETFTFRFPRMLFLKRPADDYDDFYFFNYYYLAEPFETAQFVYEPYWGKQDLEIPKQCLNHNDQTLLSCEDIKVLISLFWQTTFIMSSGISAAWIEHGINEMDHPCIDGMDRDKQCASALEMPVAKFKKALT